jgi:hypothetical protein
MNATLAPLTAARLLEMAPAQLDEAFAGGSARAIPAGVGRGTAIAFAGTEVAKPLSRVLGLLAWQGKAFDPSRGDLMNLVSPFGIRAVRAQVYRAPSWVDGKDCVVLDYSRSSKVAGWLRDEIREVAPGLYLGVAWGVGRVFGGRRQVLRFALTFGA